MGVPLSTDSNHAPSVHKAWTKAELRRLARNSSCHSSFSWAKGVFLSRLEGFFYDETILRELRSDDPFLRRLVMDAIGTRPAPKQEEKQPLVLSCPFHWCWFYAGLARHFKTVVQSAGSSDLERLWNPWPYGKAVTAWKLGGTHLKDFAKRISTGGVSG